MRQLSNISAAQDWLPKAIHAQTSCLSIVSLQSRKQLPLIARRQCSCTAPLPSIKTVSRVRDFRSEHSSPKISRQPLRASSTTPKRPSDPSPPASSTLLDHRSLGSTLDLFSPTLYSAGSPLLHPDGAHIFLKLQALLRAQYAAFGFREVITPTIYKRQLWETSGHWANYHDDMFEVYGGHRRGSEASASATPSITSTDASVAKPTEHSDNNDLTWSLKPMNCPGHCLLYAQRPRSWRELPIRYADFSPLHRNEVSGALSGLTRVRRFHQDDGHVFCRPDQLASEIDSALQLVSLVYTALGLGDAYRLALSTRPANAQATLGTADEWTLAEQQLEDVLKQQTIPWTRNDGDGAFYGPKIDILIRDAQGKKHQTATIQLDFQLPRRFDLTYIPPEAGATDSSSDVRSSAALSGESATSSSSSPATSAPPTSSPVRPVLIHRAVLGSLERFLAILLEKTQGRLPFWLSPRQLALLTLVTEPASVVEYTQEIAAALNGSTAARRMQLQPLRTVDDCFRVDVDARPQSVASKLVDAHAHRYQLTAVVGPHELSSRRLMLNLRSLPIQHQERIQAMAAEHGASRERRGWLFDVEGLRAWMAWMRDQYI